jgi:hypothetical protein
MPFSEAYHPRPPLRETLLRGILIGLSGGLAEFVFVWAYMTDSGQDPAAIARAVASAFHLGAAPSTGVIIHMMLSILLGTGLTGVWLSVRGPHARAASAYLFMAAALVVVWSFNFLVLLPSLSPALMALLPYPVSFTATLLFGLAGAPVLQRLCHVQHLALLRSRASNRQFKV